MGMNEGCWEISWWFIEALNTVDKPPLLSSLETLFLLLTITTVLAAMPRVAISLVMLSQNEMNWAVQVWTRDKVPDHVGFLPQQSADKIDDLSYEQSRIWSASVC